jgi:5'-nucleotidase (lipoprotein e(P4) family)
MKKSLALALLFAIFACKQTSDNKGIVHNDNLNDNLTNFKNSEYLAQAILWFQQSPEMVAIYLQGFNIAKKSLDNNIKHKKYPKKKNAIVVDIDETILNNSPFEGWLYISDNSYTDSRMNYWIKDTIAQPLPGAVDFLDHVNKLGCEIFYVSNRNKYTELIPTLLNLKKFKLPCADEAHLMLKDTTITGDSNKERRRLLIENELNYEILLLCGDQVTDFYKAFNITSNSSKEEIQDSLMKYQDLFGTRFIILPNPMYGDWLRKIVLGNDHNNTSSHLDSLRKGKTINWKRHI